MRRSVFLLLSALLSAVPAWSSCPPQAAKGKSRLDPEPYVRIVNGESNVVQLQIAVRKFLPPEKKGPVVWLTGVSHIGESNYFGALQKHLDAQTLVLFEGVKDSDEGKEAAKPDNDDSASGATVRKVPRSTLQGSMADSLGLAFQLTTIDYRRPNFRNSDLSVPQLRRLIRDEHIDGAAEGFESLLQMMESGSFWDGLLQIAFRFLGSNPKLQGLSKLALVEVLGQIKGDPGRLATVSPAMKQLLEVLIERRNHKVIEDVRTEIKTLRRRDSIAIFYGTGHMRDLEMHLREDLGYQPENELWLTAFSVDLPKAGISASEHEFIRTFIKRQLEMQQPK